MPNDDEPAFDALVAAMKQNPRPLALLGAGTSVDSGYPTWNGLLSMFEKIVFKEPGSKYQAFLKDLNDPAWQAEEYRRMIGENDFDDLIKKEFASRGRVGALLQAIVALRFRHILTTNYDPCIEEAFKMTNSQPDVADWNDEPKMRKFFQALSLADVTPHLIYLHGRYDEPSKVVLTETSYANRYVRTEDANRKLFAILLTQPVVFIGFSVNDPDLNHLMREVNARLGRGIPQHYAMVGIRIDEQKELIKNRFEGKYGIRPIFYKIKLENDAENHAELLAKLKELYLRVYGSPLSIPELETQPVPPGGSATFRGIGDISGKGPEAAPPPHGPLDPLDQQKGRWGGKSESKNRRLRVENIVESQSRNFCKFDLVVESANQIPPPLTGEVIFHLHQTFNPDRVVKPVKADGCARASINGYGAFTVGVEADAGKTKLELDLAQLDQFPQWFRDR